MTWCTPFIALETGHDLFLQASFAVHDTPGLHCILLDIYFKADPCILNLGAPEAVFAAWAAPFPPPFVRGGLHLFDGADDEEFGPFDEGFFQAAPRRLPEVHRRRPQHALMRANLQARVDRARAGRPNAVPLQPPPPPPQQVPVAPPYAPFVPLGPLQPLGAIPVPGYQGLPMFLPPQEGPAAQVAPFIAQPAPQQAVAGLGVLPLAAGNGPLMNALPAANGFFHLLNPPAAINGPAQVFNPGVRDQRQDFQQLELERQLHHQRVLLQQQGAANRQN